MEAPRLSAEIDMPQGKYELVARWMDGCLGGLPSSLMPAGWAAEEQCIAVLSLVQLLMVWVLPLILLSRCALLRRDLQDHFASVLPCLCGYRIPDTVLSVRRFSRMYLASCPLPGMQL